MILAKLRKHVERTSYRPTRNIHHSRPDINGVVDKLHQHTAHPVEGQRSSKEQQTTSALIHTIGEEALSGLLPKTSSCGFTTRGEGLRGVEVVVRLRTKTSAHHIHWPMSPQAHYNALQCLLSIHVIKAPKPQLPKALHGQRRRVCTVNTPVVDGCAIELQQIHFISVLRD